MITVEQILKYAEIKKLKIDFFSECFEGKRIEYKGEFIIDEFNEVYLPQTHIGLQINSYTWFWWKYESKDENPYIFFNQRFNAGSGHTIKTRKCGFNMEYKILEFLNEI